MALLFVGVAASSAFQNARDVRLTPGQTMRVGDHDFTYVRATSRVSTNAGDLEKISFGAVVEVRRDGEKVVTLRPERSYFPSRDLAGLGPVGRFFEGEATSEVGLKAGMRRDLWAAMTPDIRRLMPTIEEGDRVFAAAAGKLPPALEGQALGEALNGIVRRYTQSEPAATFRVISSPLVTWIWIGAIVVFLGGLIALWPGPDAARRRASARYAARVAEDLPAARKRPAPRTITLVDVVALLVIVVVLVAVLAIVAAPLRPGARERVRGENADAIAELEAQKEAKYREIRDAEMDLRTGKLSDGGPSRPRPPAAGRGRRDPQGARRRGRGRRRARLRYPEAMENILSGLQVLLSIA